MQTKLLKNSKQDIKTAGKLLKDGELVAIPTETVYGLAADALNGEAVANIFKAKGRPMDNPLIVHIADLSQVDDLVAFVPPVLEDLAKAFWPGPLTVILEKSDLIPDEVSAGLDTVAIRMPSHPVARAIIKAAGTPLAAPSANTSGKPSTTSAQHVLNDYGAAGPLAAIVDAGPCRVGVESTIVSLLGERPRLLRPGGVGPEQLREVLGRLEVDQAVTGLLSDDAVVRAPGMKYKHYAPRAQVIVVEGPSETAAKYIRSRLDKNSAVLCFREELPLYGGCQTLAYGRESDPQTLSAGLFAALRELDRDDISTIYARCPTGGGVACAVRNRLLKAAGFRTVRAEETL